MFFFWGVGNVRILGVVNVRLANNLTPTKSGFRFTLRSPSLPCLDSPSHTWSRLLQRTQTGDQTFAFV